METRVRHELSPRLPVTLFSPPEWTEPFDPITVRKVFLYERN
jgi:hypothetical protein